MLLIRPRREKTVRKRRLVKISSTEVATRIEVIFAAIALPLFMFFTGENLTDSFMIVMQNLHYIAPVIIVLVWTTKTLLNIGQKIVSE